MIIKENKGLKVKDSIHINFTKPGQVWYSDLYGLCMTVRTQREPWEWYILYLEHGTIEPFPKSCPRVKTLTTILEHEPIK